MLLFPPRLFFFFRPALPILPRERETCPRDPRQVSPPPLLPVLAFPRPFGSRVRPADSVTHRDREGWGDRDGLGCWGCRSSPLPPSSRRQKQHRSDPLSTPVPNTSELYLSVAVRLRQACMNCARARSRTGGRATFSQGDPDPDRSHLAADPARQKSVSPLPLKPRTPPA